jgi:hypothetical protein
VADRAGISRKQQGGQSNYDTQTGKRSLHGKPPILEHLKLPFPNIFSAQRWVG